MAGAAVRVRHVLLAGGGTGGHVFPAVALAAELAARSWKVSFAGMSGGREAVLAAKHELPFHPLPAGKFLGQSPRARVAAVWALGRGAWRARRLVRALEVDAVVGTGGYVSAPAVLGGHWAGKPVLLFEPNARAGVANRWLSRWAQAAAVAWEPAARDLRCPVRVTGIPLRPEFLALPTAMPPAPPWRLLVLGGSQGAQQLNRLLPRALRRLAAELPELTVIHQCGEAHLQETRRAYLDLRAPSLRVEITPFLDNVAEAMAGSHLLVSRAGAITCAEICAAGRAAVLLPLRIAGAHQADNARRLADAGAAMVLDPGEGDAEILVEHLHRLLGDRSRLQEMGRRARALARPRAAAAIADLVDELGGQP